MALIELCEDEETITCSSCARPRREADLILHQGLDSNLRTEQCNIYMQLAVFVTL